MRDIYTNTEDDAGHFEQNQAHDDTDRDRDVPSDGPPPEHTCTSPDLERCLLCVLEAVVTEQKADRG